MEQIPSYKKCRTCKSYVTREDVEELKQKSLRYKDFDYENSELCCPRCGYNNIVKVMESASQDKIPNDYEKLNLSRKTQEILDIMFGESTKRTI